MMYSHDISLTRAIRFVCMLSLVQSFIVNAKAFEDIPLHLTPVDDDYGQIIASWEEYDGYEDKQFRLFRQDDGTQFETVQIDLTHLDGVKVQCLQIYPTETEIKPGFWPWEEDEVIIHDDAKNQLRDWVQNSEYGHGIISVNSVQITDFNSNPSLYVKNSDGEWAYDVIFFGTWDSNGYNDISTQGAAIVKEFIEAGRGVIFGHDTIVNNSLDFPNFRSLAQYAGVEIYDNGQMQEQSYVTVMKDGLLTTYPNYIGTIGTVLSIPQSHTGGQVVTDGTQWLQFNSAGSVMPGGITAPQYLTTHNNVALIQTGHSNGEATSDEQKILANVIFYCKQLIVGIQEQRDLAARDYGAPEKPEVTYDELNKTYKVSGDDTGTEYFYYVESYDSKDLQLDTVIGRQGIEKVYQETGVTQVGYIFDNNASTEIKQAQDAGISLVDYGKDVKLQPGFQYLHLVLLDGAGNISETATVSISYKVVYNSNYPDVDSSEQKSLEIEVDCNDNEYEIVDNQFSDNESLRFISWNTNPNGTGIEYYPGDLIKLDKNIKLYAQWDMIYDLVIDPQQGAWKDNHGTIIRDGAQDNNPLVSTEPQGQEYSGKITFYLGEDDTKLIDDPYRIGYNFNGWEIQA